MRRSSCWIGAVGALAAGGLASMLVSAACSTGDCSINGCPSTSTCTLDTATNTAVCKPNPVMSSGTGTGTGTGEGDASGHDAGFGFGNPPSWAAGDGGACLGSVGSTPSPTCDPSDETLCAAGASNGCAIAPQCTAGEPACEAFTKNTGPVKNFRMRYIEITAPATLASPMASPSFVQSNVVTLAVDLPSKPDGGVAAQCGENGTGFFNWLMSIDTVHKVVKTGGAPFSADPFSKGYCYFNAMVGMDHIGPIPLQATFTGNEFSTAPYPQLLNIPIFQSATDFSTVVILPINGVSFDNVTVSNDGNCIGAVNNNSLSAGSCIAGTPGGVGACARWHTGGALSGYITLKLADLVPVIALGGNSLCTLLTGQSDGKSPAKCPPAALTAGDFCQATLKPGGCGDSFWLSAIFSASAVNINDGAGVTACAAGDGG